MAQSNSDEPVFPGFHFTNEVLLKGGDHVKDLRVLHDTVNNTFTSRWQLTKEEIQAIIETGNIYITILGTCHPAIAIKAGVPEGTEHGVVVKPAPIKDGHYADIAELNRIMGLPEPLTLHGEESDASGTK